LTHLQSCLLQMAQNHLAVGTGPYRQATISVNASTDKLDS